MKARIPNQPQGGRNDMMAKLQKTFETKLEAKIRS